MPISEEMKSMLARPIGRIPSGVYILTASHGGEQSAMLASWVQQASFNPPTLSVAVAKGRPISAIIRDSGRFAISIVPAGDTSLMKKYGKGVPPGEDPFAGMNTITTPAGLIVLADSLAWLECEVLQGVEFGGCHELVIGRITSGAALKDEQPYVHVRKNGFGY